MKPNWTIFKSSVSYSEANLWNSLLMNLRGLPTQIHLNLEWIKKTKPPAYNMENRLHMQNTLTADNIHPVWKCFNKLINANLPNKFISIEHVEQ